VRKWESALSEPSLLLSCGLFGNSGRCQFAPRGAVKRPISTTTAMIAFQAPQLSDETRFSQCARRGENHGMLCFVIPKFFEAHRLCPFHCHGVNIVPLSPW
jgi:hypothetical protein